MALAVFELIINPDENSDIEVDAVAFVDKPAIEKNFIAFNEPLYFAADPEQRIVSGPAMIADQLIYRRDQQGEYNVFFSKDTIKQIALKFFKKDLHKNLNLFHDPLLTVDGVTIFESFVSDKSRGIQPMKGFKDLPDGTWFISAKIDNEAVWNKIKSGEVKGFSVEGIFSYIKKGSGTVKADSHLMIENTLMGLIDDIKKIKEHFMGPSAPAPTGAPAPTQTLKVDLTLKDGTPVSADKLEVGGLLSDATGAPCAAGEYELSDGSKVSVGDGGQIMAVAPAGMPGEQPAPPPPNYEKQFSDMSEKLTQYDAAFSGFSQKFAEQSNTINQLSQSFNKQNETIMSLVEVVEKLAQTPTAEPVSHSTNNFSVQKQTREERTKELAATLQKIKNK